MELGFIFSAIRRRWWLVPALALVGFLLASAVPEAAGNQYEARSVLLIQPPTNQAGATVFLNDPDRYVIGQLSVLKNPSLIAAIASNFPGEDEESLAKGIEVGHEPRTDIVTIQATFDEPLLAEKVANALADRYIQDLKTRATESAAAPLKDFDVRIAAVTARLLVLDKTRAEQQSIISQSNTLVAQTSALNPQTEARQRLEAAQLSLAAIETERSTVLSDYVQIVQSRNELTLAANFKVASEVVQRAVEPTTPKAVKTQMLRAAGVLAGAIIGAMSAIFWARWSRKVLDVNDAQSEIGVPMVGAIRGRLGTDLEKLLVNVPNKERALIDQLCVRAEGAVAPHAPLTIAVVGSDRPADVTAVAVAMACRFARNGSRVTLVDADPSDARITKAFGATASGGIPALVARVDASSTPLRRGSGVLDASREVFTTSSNPSVQILGLGAKAEQQPLRRNEILAVIEAAKDRDGSIVVIDGGDLLESSASLALVRSVDVVVLAVPVARQDRDDLRVTVDQLSDVIRAKRLLPLVTNPARSRASNQTSRMREPVDDES